MNDWNHYCGKAGWRMRFGANEKTPVGKSLEKRIPIQSHRRWVTAVYKRAIHFYTKKPNEGLEEPSRAHD